MEPPRIVIESHGSPPPYPPKGGDSDTTVAKLVRTLQFIKRWAGQAEQPIDQRKAFMERLGMSIPDADDAYKSDSPNLGNSNGVVAVSRSRHKKHQFTFNPSGIWLYRWLAVVSLAVVFNTFVIILRTTFTDINGLLGLWMTLDYVADTIYLIDILIQFRTSTFVKCFFFLHAVIYLHLHRLS